MSKQRDGEPWMSADEYGRSLTGLTVNLLVRDMQRAQTFHDQVLAAEELYLDSDFAAYQFKGAQWMLHADHTYDGHPLHPLLEPIDPRGIGAELRLHGRDPDEAVRVALELGYTVLAAPADKPHGTREAFIFDADGYLWVPDVPI